jgi:hypothetical protein
MSPRTIALLVAGAVVLVAILGLFLDVREAPARPNPAEIDDARQRHRARRVAPAASTMADPWARPSEAARPLPIGRGGVREPEPVPPPTPREAAVPNLEGDPRLALATTKDEANRLYDKMDYEAAMTHALSVLEREPGDVRMLRVVVSSACQLGDADKARQYWTQLPPHDQNQMNRRCQRYGITFQ